MKRPISQWVRITDVIPYEKNPRRNDQAVDFVANSIREFGFKNPIIVDRRNVIIAGHTRLKAAQKLGLKEVPIIRATGLTEEQVKAFRLADNKTAELAAWDYTALEQELGKLNIDMSQFGLYETDIEAKDDTEEAELLDLSEKPGKTCRCPFCNFEFER